ncbi:MAG: hypothetical protein V7676_17175 [Parasphingorhabdus sp.]|uniref:hypothetical protein n=1 Tax=Parasphingorhabdus sp. TaxID=2709688 RepID=UPI0030013403
MHRALIITVPLLLAACSEPTQIVVPEPEVPMSSDISLDGFSFFLPVGLEFEGGLEKCTDGLTQCPLGDDSTHIVWRSADLRFDYVADPYSGNSNREDWGEPITINGRPAFHKQLRDGGRRYLITNHYGGGESAQVAIWRATEEPMFWGECQTDFDCDLVLQTLAGVVMRSAELQCRQLFPPEPKKWTPPPGYREPAEGDRPPAPLRTQPPVPTAPPAPPAPRPKNAQELCKGYLDAA